MQIILERGDLHKFRFGRSPRNWYRENSNVVAIFRNLFLSSEILPIPLPLSKKKKKRTTRKNKDFSMRNEIVLTIKIFASKEKLEN